MVRMFQPLPRIVNPPSVSHVELVTKDDGKVEEVKVDDCRNFCEPEDFDFDVMIRSGDKIKSVNTVLGRGRSLDGVRLPVNYEQTNENNVNEKEQENEN